MPPRVVAVVVTWNRRPLLERLVAAVLAQERLPEELIVVDNASTDGSGQWAAGVRGAVPVRVVTLPDNTGGAGGFHAGIAAAMQSRVDLVWLMDDDGVPEPSCLRVLLEYQDHFDFWGPAVVAEGDPDTFCFPLRLPGTSRVLRGLAEARVASRDGLLDDVLIPFNGVLVTRQLVDEIGLPRAEFFIWGDDVEYLWRARRAGGRVATVLAARFRHPVTDDLGARMMFGLTTYNHTPSDLKHYCLVRNNVTNLRDYRGPAAVLAFLAKTFWFYSFTKPSTARLRLSVEALRAARRKDFTGHRRLVR